MAHAFLTRDGVLDPPPATQLQPLKEALARGGCKLALHLHGGLVDQKAGEAIAKRLSGGPPKGFTIGPEWEQAYVVWRTGALESVGANWTELLDRQLQQVSADDLFKTLLVKVLKFAGDHFGPAAPGRGGGDAALLTETEIKARLMDGGLDGPDPFADLDRSAAFRSADPRGGGRGMAMADPDEAAIAFALSIDPDIAKRAADIAAADHAAGRGPASAGDHTAGERTLTTVDPGIAAELAAPGSEPAARSLISSANIVIAIARHGAAIVLRVVRRFRSGRDHGLYCTCIEEILRELYGDRIGIAVWGFMKQDGADHFRPGRFGDQLLDIIRMHPPERMVITGHSAGSIFATELLLAAAAKGVPGPFDVAFMVPAVRIRRFAEALTKARAQIGRFRLFAMHDALEQNDALLSKAPRLYPRSLLYIVSGLFEASDGAPAPDAPLLGMERFLGMDPNLLSEREERAALSAVLAFLATAQNGVVYSKSEGQAAGLNTLSISHGDFDAEAQTLASVSTFY